MNAIKKTIYYIQITILIFWIIAVGPVTLTVLYYYGIIICDYPLKYSDCMYEPIRIWALSYLIPSFLSLVGVLFYRNYLKKKTIDNAFERAIIIISPILSVLMLLAAIAAIVVLFFKSDFS